MFGHRALLPLGFGQCGRAKNQQCLLQGADRFQQIPVARGVDQGAVKLAVGLLRGSPDRGRSQLGVQCHKLFDLDRQGHPRGKAGRRALQHRPHLIKLDHLAIFQPAHRGPLTRQMGDQPVGLKLANRLAHGGAADAQTLGQFGFAQPRAGQKAALLDL